MQDHPTPAAVPPRSRYERVNAAGVIKQHQTACARRNGRRCGCDASYRATSVRDPITGKPETKAFRSLEAAKRWRADVNARIRDGRYRVSDVTVAQAWAEFREGVETGSIRNKGGRPYKPGVWRGYPQKFDNYLLPASNGTAPGAATGPCYNGSWTS